MPIPCGISSFGIAKQLPKNGQFFLLSSGLKSAIDHRSSSGLQYLGTWRLHRFQGTISWNHGEGFFPRNSTASVFVHSTLNTPNTESRVRRDFHIVYLNAVDSCGCSPVADATRLRRADFGIIRESSRVIRCTYQPAIYSRRLSYRVVETGESAVLFSQVKDRRIILPEVSSKRTSEQVSLLPVSIDSTQHGSG